MGWLRDRREAAAERAAQDYAVMDDMLVAVELGTDAAMTQFGRGRDAMAEHWQARGWDVPEAWGFGELPR